MEITMFYWQAVRNEFYNRYARDYFFMYTTLRYYPEEDESMKTDRIERKQYPFNQDGSLYLTQREADCIYYMVQGLTIKGTAEELLLSARTVEFYLKRIKDKFNIQSKKQLLNYIQQSEYFEDFYRAIDHEFNA